MWEIEISGILLFDRPRRVPAHSSFPFFRQVRRSHAHPFCPPAQKYPTVRVGNMRAHLLRATSRRVSRVRNVITGHTGRLHHTQSEVLDELVNRGLVDQITRWVTNDPILATDPQTFCPVPTRFASTCIRLKQYTVGSTPPATHSTSDTSFQ